MRRLFLLLIVLFPMVGFADQQVTYGPTTKTDQLWQIAIMVRPNAQVSIKQTMLAILQKNPQAFKHDNSSEVKPGVVLHIPSLAEIQQTASDRDIAWNHKLEHIGKGVVARRVGQLQTQLTSVGKALVNFDQQYQARIADSEKQNLALQNQVAQLQQQLAALHDETAQLQQPSQFKLWIAPYVNYLRENLGQRWLVWSLVVVFVVLLLFIWMPCWLPWLWRSRGKKKTVDKTADTAHEDTESEYDFMGSKEGIPAKLDLARAYVDMGDKEAAHDVLTEIIAQGNAEQQTEAQKLLEQIE